jgi:ABC-type multidrug transport system permease subunit
VLPGWLRVIADASPLTYVLKAMRTAISDGSNTGKVFEQTLLLVGIASVMLPLSLLALNWAFSYARSRGSLARF